VAGWGAAAGEGRKLALGALAALGLGALLAGVQLAPTLAALPEYVAQAAATMPTSPRTRSTRCASPTSSSLS